MEDPLSKGFPFDISDIWRESVLSLDPENNTLLQPLSADLPDLQFGEKDKTYLLELELPQLFETNWVGQQDLERIESEVPSPVTASILSESQVLEDPWTLDYCLHDANNLPRSRTWEAFEKKDIPNSESTAYLSEAGPNVFDAARACFEWDSPSSGVLPQDVMLKALCNLSLGRSSVFFQWDSAKQAFTRTLADAPTSGYSLTCTRSLAQKLIDYGTVYRMLNDFASAKPSTNKSCAALIALKGCISKTLDTVEERTIKSISSIRSALQLQRMIERPYQLLEMLNELRLSVSDCSADEEAISVLSDQIHRITSAETCFGETLRVVLARVSAPWLERLCVEVGLTNDQLGASHINPEEDEEVERREVNSSVSGVQSKLARNLPRITSDEDCALIQETKLSLKALRRHLPDFRLTLPTSKNSTRRWSGPNLPTSQSMRIIESSEFPETPIQESGLDRITIEGRFSKENELGPGTNLSENHIWTNEELQHEYTNELDGRISEPLKEVQSSLDGLQASITHALGHTKSSYEIAGLASTLNLDPIEQLRPLIQGHARQINKVLLRHIFTNCRLRHHLDLQRQYHLFGNGDFAGRLATALFSAETQSAERKRGTVPTGETMGLRLGTRDEQRWPPASSELRLTLIGVLTETYRPEVPERTMYSNIKELPGGLSFSIRELPDEDIERVMDSGSLYALDFLRLQYTAPPCLDAVLTPSSMHAYDSVFRYLLRLLRIVHVTTTLDERFATSLDGQRARSRKESCRAQQFAINAHQFILTLMSHVVDLGIEAPWRQFMSSIDDIEKGLDAEADSSTPTPGLDDIRQLHESCLETIRSRLFLRRKQEKIRNAIETFLSAILACAFALQAEEEPNFQQFDQSVKELLGILRATIDKPAKAKMDTDAAEHDADAIRILMNRLNWNGFYDDNI